MTMAPRRILLVSGWFPTQHAPINGIFVARQASILAKRYDVAVLHLASWLDAISARGRPVPIRPPGVQHVETILLPAPRFAGPIFYRGIESAAKRALQSLRSAWGEADLVHAHVVTPGGFAALAIARACGIPAVLTEHSSPFTMHLDRPVHETRALETLSNIDGIVAVSPALAQELSALVSTADIHVVGNVVPEHFFEPPLDDRRSSAADPFRFLCVAMLTRRKRVGDLIEATAILAREGGPSFEVVVVGDGPERDALQRRAETLGLGATMRFLGKIQPDAVVGEMAAADAFVLPSPQETFGLVLAEALAVGLPVLAARSGGAEYVIGEGCGMLIPPRDVPALARALDGMRRRSVNFTREFLRDSVRRRFGEAAFLDHISAIYDEVGQNSRKGRATILPVSSRR